MRSPARFSAAIVKATHHHQYRSQTHRVQSTTVYSSCSYEWQRSCTSTCHLLQDRWSIDRHSIFFYTRLQPTSADHRRPVTDAGVPPTGLVVQMPSQGSPRLTSTSAFTRTQQSLVCMRDNFVRHRHYLAVTRFILPRRSTQIIVI